MALPSPEASFLPFAVDDLAFGRGFDRSGAPVCSEGRQRVSADSPAFGFPIYCAAHHLVRVCVCVYGMWMCRRRSCRLWPRISPRQCPGAMMLLSSQHQPTPIAQHSIAAHHVAQLIRSLPDSLQSRECDPHAAIPREVIIPSRLAASSLLTTCVHPRSPPRYLIHDRKGASSKSVSRTQPRKASSPKCSAGLMRCGLVVATPASAPSRVRLQGHLGLGTNSNRDSRGGHGRAHYPEEGSREQSRPWRLDVVERRGRPSD